MKLENFKHGLSSWWDTVSEGWQHLRQSASSALTCFRPNQDTALPSRPEVTDIFFIPSGTWSMLGGNVFEDEQRVVVQVEVPGVDKVDMDIELRGMELIIRGEKRFERETTEGRYHVLQCAYGSFERTVALPAAVLADQASARYRNGVLRVELPKASAGEPRGLNIKME